MIFSNKKGLGIGQVFVFIVAAITFAVIMIFGYRAIGDFLESGEDVAFVQFKTNLENSVQKISTEFGSVRVETFTTPATYTQICFVNLNAPFDDGLCSQDAAACTVWQDAQSANGYDSADENVFLKPPAPVKIKVHTIGIESAASDGYLCLPIKRGAFELVLEGKGDRTVLSQRPAQS